MFTKLMRSFCYGVASLLMSVIAIPAYAGLIELPSYIDNSKCLNDPKLGCTFDDLEWSSELDKSVNIRDFYKSLYLTAGKLYLYWPSGDYTNLQGGNATIPNYPSWTPVGGYMFRLGRDGINAGDIPINVELTLERGGQVTTEPAHCTGKLRLATRFYRNHIGKGNGLACTIPAGAFPVSFRVYAGLGKNIPILFGMRDPSTRDRTIKIPSALIGFAIEGHRSVDMLGNPEGPLLTPDAQTTKIMNAGGKIYLNDRLCKISSPNTQIDFGNVSTTAPEGKIAERVMPLTVTCAGVPQAQDCSNCRPKEAWKGVDNNLVAISISHPSENRFPGAEPDKKIGLKTNDIVRNDLFVEGSWLRSERCGVAPLWTNGTKNDIKDINVPAAESASASLPTLYWRLCAKPNDGLVKAGQFNGQATISVEYN